MRARIFFLAGAVTCLAAAFGVQACGETEEVKPVGAPDSGADVAIGDAAKEAAPVEQDSATCDLSADFSDQIPDAAIPDSSTTTGLCLQCAKTSCKKAIDDCNQNCECQGVAGDGIGCVLANAGKSLQQIAAICGGNFTGVSTETQQLGFAVIGCLQSQCKDECATESFQPPSDGGTDADAQ